MGHHEQAAGRSERTRRGFVRFLLYCTLPAAFCPLFGCKSNQKYDLIEAELRTRNNEVRELRCALEQSRVMNQAYEQQLRTQPASLTSHQRPALAPGICVKDITLARGTGGYDEDDCPGDEALMVVVVPQDEDGSPVKVPARLTVAAWQIDEQGLKTPIGQWDISPEKLRPMWKTGLMSNGYSATLPWQTFPSTNRVRIAARLTTLDGRSFEADRDVSIRPMPPQQPRVGVNPSLPPPSLAPGLPPPVYELPQPESGVLPSDELPPPQGVVP